MEPERKHPEDIPGRDRAAAEQAAKRETRRLLRDLVVKAVPAVPRKLNRVGELFRLCLEVASENGWPMTERKEQLTLLRFIILQLLAPDLYRFIRRNPGLFSKLEIWSGQFGVRADIGRVDDYLRTMIKEAEDKLKSNPNDSEAIGKLDTLRRNDQQLLRLVRAACQHRSQFHPFELFDKEAPCDDDIQCYFNLELGSISFSGSTSVKFSSSSVSGKSSGLGSNSAVSIRSDAIPPIGSVGRFREIGQLTDDRTPAAPSDLEGFFNQLFSGDEIAWRNAILQEAERLNGHVLDTSSFNTLLDRVRRAPHVVSVRWLEQLDPYLSADQLVALYRESKLLQRLNDAIQGAQSS